MLIDPQSLSPLGVLRVEYLNNVSLQRNLNDAIYGYLKLRVKTRNPQFQAKF